MGFMSFLPLFAPASFPLSRDQRETTGGGRLALLQRVLPKALGMGL